MLQLPETPLDACRKVSTTASSLSLVASMQRLLRAGPLRPPSALVKGYVDRVEVFHKAERIAVHERIWAKEQVSFEPVHYWLCWSANPGPWIMPALEDWQLPECFTVLRLRLESELKGNGTREYIRVLEAPRKAFPRRLAQAIEKALAVRHTAVMP